jgi:hypothetical protein
MAIVYFDNNYTVVTSDRVFQGDLDGGTFTEEATFTPTTTLATDAIVFEDASALQLIVTTATNFARWTGGGSIDYALGSLTADVPHPLCIFDSNPTYKLTIGNGNEVKTYDTSYVANSTILTLPSQFVVTCLRYRNGFLYVGTKTTDGSEARIFIWNGSGTNAQYEVPVGAEWVFSMTEYDSSVAAIVSSGQLIQVSGSSYQQLAALPVYYDPSAKWQDGTGLTLNGKVFNRGMVAIGKTIYMNIDGSVDVGTATTMRSGIWVYDPEVGLYHRGSATVDELVRDNALSVTNSIITTSASHNLKTGDAVQFSSVSGLSGVGANRVYFVTVLSATTIKLSTSRQALVNEQYVTITGTAGASDNLVYFPNTDSGYHYSTSGAIVATTAQETPLEMLASDVIFGCRNQNFEGTTTFTLNAFHDSYVEGSFTTQRIYTENIEQAWKQIYTFVDGIVTDEDVIVVKTQTKHQKPSPVLNGAWLTTTTINSNNTNYLDSFNSIQVGDELVFVDGYGQGKTANVEAVEISGSTVSVTIDRAIGTINETTNFYVTNYYKVGEFGASVKENEFVKTLLPERNKSPWIKIKVELRGADMAVNMLELSNVIHKNT